MRHWIFSCRQTSAMISESMDSKPSLPRRMGIRFHIMMCKLCRRYQKQLLFMAGAMRSQAGSDACCKLSAEGRQRIKTNLEKTLKISR